ncbi:MAG: 2-oxoacid:acceptor oxidoreductase family protein [Bacteroidetes bacterium]|nr:2-oxoacid:acceptor oxidoreductase family protein [Bacteroidota bacterium]
MDNTFLIDSRDLPFCKGCGHSSVAQMTEKALANLGYQPLDVIMVTDIGCHGIIDKSLRTHTVHGLHGRSVAIAGGIAHGLGRNSGKKVIVFLGDGGATIGLQHILIAAHHNFPMTVVVHNNMLYGMTGGQPSEYTPDGFNTPTSPNRSSAGALDIVQLAEAAGAGYVSRIAGIGDFSAELAEAFAYDGFSLVEVMEICPSYGVKSNPGMKLRQLMDETGYLATKKVRPPRPHHQALYEGFNESLISDRLIVDQSHMHNLPENTIRLLLAGSAGEGTQSAAEFLARVAMRNGLQTSKKGHYPVTVGVGFSAAEVILSTSPIYYTGGTNPDYLLITSADGLDYAKPYLARATEKAVVLLDESLPLPETRAKVLPMPLRNSAGVRNAAMMSIFRWAKLTGMLHLQSLIEEYQRGKLASKVPVETFV